MSDNIDSDNAGNIRMPTVSNNHTQEDILPSTPEKSKPDGQRINLNTAAATSYSSKISSPTEQQQPGLLRAWSSRGLLSKQASGGQLTPVPSSPAPSVFHSSSSTTKSHYHLVARPTPVWAVSKNSPSRANTASTSGLGEGSADTGAVGKDIGNKSIQFNSPSTSASPSHNTATTATIPDLSVTDTPVNVVHTVSSTGSPKKSNLTGRPIFRIPGPKSYTLNNTDDGGDEEDDDVVEFPIAPHDIIHTRPSRDRFHSDIVSSSVPHPHQAPHIAFRQGHYSTSSAASPFINGPSQPTNDVEIPTVEKSRWTSLIETTSRPEFCDSSGIIDEKALENQGDLNSLWVGYQRELAMKQLQQQKLGKRKKSSSTIAGKLFSRGRSRSSAATLNASGGADNDNENKGTSSDLNSNSTTSEHEPYSVSSARYFVSEESRQTWKPRLNFILLNNPYVPLTLRTIIFILSVAALALAASVYVHSRDASPDPITQQPSTIMAVVVQSTALVYLVYITYDEYSGKPLGLRDAKAKMRLIMLDLLFIIFSSANLSLTFNTLYDVTWTCQNESFANDPNDPLIVPYSHPICTRQRALASFLFMVLVMWVSTFTISIFRLVERVSQ